MDALLIRPAGSPDVVPHGPNGANANGPAGGIPASFTALLLQAAAPVGVGLGVVTDSARIVELPDPAETPAGRDAYDPRADTGAPVDAGDPPPDDHVDGGPDYEPARGYGNDGAAEHDHTGAGGNGDQTPHDGGTPPATDAAATAASAPPQDTAPANPAPGPGNETAGAPVAAGGSASATDSGGNVALAVNGKDVVGLAASPAANLPDTAAAQAGPRAGQGLATAAAAVATQTPAHGGNPGGAQTNAQGQQPQQQAPANPGAQANAAASGGNGAARQAAALSTTVGDGNPVSVSVTVTNGASTLVSQPNSNLAASAVLPGPGGTPSPAASSPMYGAAGALAAAAQAAGATGQVQAQQVQAGTEATAPAAGTTSASGATQPAQAQAPGGETTAQGGPGTLGNVNQTQHQAASQVINNAHRAGAPRPTVVDQISVNITKALGAGLDRISIQLKPASLGRIDVHLDVGHDGRVLAVVTADNRDTLTLLQRDARELQQALQDAGLQTDSGTLSFNLRGENDQAPGDDPQGSAPLAGEDIAAASDTGTPDALLATEYQGGILADGRIDIRA